MNESLYKTAFFVLLILTMCGAVAHAQVASNPPYTLDQSVVAAGGGTSADTGNIYSITGTIGQPITDSSTASPFTIKSGFFTAAPIFGPTAAMVTVGGRVLTTSGRGIRNVLIILTDGHGAIRTTVSSTFGYYRFRDVEAGETYILAARGKRFSFSQPTQVVSVSEEIADVNFFALPQQ